MSLAHTVKVIVCGICSSPVHAEAAQKIQASQCRCGGIRAMREKKVAMTKGELVTHDYSNLAKALARRTPRRGVPMCTTEFRRRCEGDCRDCLARDKVAARPW